MVELESGLSHENDEGQQIKGKPYAQDQVRSWGVKLCKILDYLASKNLVHMDIKPANLILDSSGDIWLVDFGTARADMWGPPPSGAQKPSIYGTPGYAPKEQYAGKPEARSDVYALAATLYHLMTDDDPREQANPFSRLPRLPQQIAKALQLALNPDVKQRITAAEFGRMLDTHSNAGPAFCWRDGAISYDPQDLVLTADRKWAEALDYFKGEDWEKWFRDLYRNNLIAQLQAIRSNAQQSDLALDAFLRVLDASYPLPRLSLPAPVLNMGMVPWRSLRQADVVIVNAVAAACTAVLSICQPA
jgi:serine/threonine protein kinase